MDIEDLRRRLVLSIAGGLAACGPSVLPDDGAGGSETGGSEGSGGAVTNASVTTQATGTAGSATADADETSDEIFDIGGPMPVDCEPQPMPPVEECTAPFPDGVSDPYFLFYCMTPAEGQGCEDWAESVDGWSITQCLLEDPCFGPDILEIGCGPLPGPGDQCCAWFATVDTQICPGRPFVVDGRERLAELVDRDDWADEVPPRAETSGSNEAPIAAAWAEQALFEHASIASFSRFVLQLLACGAPARLLTAAQVALGEEIEHARLFFGFASRYAGRAVGPSALDTHDALSTDDGFDEVVLSTVREGCIAETISAWHVAIAARAARDPAMARALVKVAEQELQHAALAWSFLAWALPRASDSLRRRVAATLHEPARQAPPGPTLSATVDDAQWLAHGILPADEHVAATRQATRELVVPLARSLMNSGLAVLSEGHVDVDHLAVEQERLVVDQGVEVCASEECPRHVSAGDVLDLRSPTFLQPDDEVHTVLGAVANELEARVSEIE